MNEPGQQAIENEAGREWSDEQNSAPTQSVIPQSALAASTHSHGPIVKLTAVLIRDYSDAEVIQELWSEGEAVDYYMPIVVDVSTMSYQNLCTLLMTNFFSGVLPGGEAWHIGWMFARWYNPSTGQAQDRAVYEYNWKEEIVDFLVQYPAEEIELEFGLEMVEQLEHENGVHPTLWA